MLATILDRLLATLDIVPNAFAQCEIHPGYRLVFDPMDTVIVHYVLAGSGTLRMANGAEAALRPDRMVVVPSGQGQSLRAGPDAEPFRDVSGDERCARLTADGLVRFTAGVANVGDKAPLVVVCGAIVASYGGGFGLFDTLRTPLTVDAAEVPGLHGSFNLLLAEISNPGIGTRALVDALMKQCLILLMRRELARNETSMLFAALRDLRLARAVISVLERPGAPYTVASLATTAGMSRTIFAARFQSAYGESPLEFVQRVRLRHAATLLRTTGMPVKVIAAAVGYGSRSHFSRAFRAAYGMDPRGYRQSGAPTDATPSGATDESGIAGMPLL